jgi:hypothetical protein
MKRFANISKLSVVLGIVALAAFVAFGLAGPANAVGDTITVLNVNMSSTNSGSYYTGLAVAPDAPANTYWNEMSSTSVASGGLKYSDGATVATGISLVAAQAAQYAFSYPISLYNALSIDTNANPYNIMTISGLTAPNTTYNLYVYAWFGSAWGWKADVVNVIGASTVGPWTSGNSGDATSGSTFIADGNYHEFAGLSASAGGTLIINVAAPGSSGYLSAFQLVSDTVVPEPSTLALLAAGLAGLLCYAWRKRK